MVMIGMMTLVFFAILGLTAFIASLIRGRTADERMQLVLPELRKNDAEIRVRSALRICEEIRIQHLICECTDEEAMCICSKLNVTHPIIELR